MITIKGTAFVISLLISTICFCQSNGTALSKEDYYNKSRKQKTASSILLGAGAVSTISAFVYGLSGDGIFGERNEQAGLFVGIGLACVTAALPLKIASNRNRRKAVGLSANFIYPKESSLKQSGIFARAYPVLSLKADL